jgi:hypothetical protein
VDPECSSVSRIVAIMLWSTIQMKHTNVKEANVSIVDVRRLSSPRTM